LASAVFIDFCIVRTACIMRPLYSAYQ
jgi:hypothetical protein